MTGDTMPQPEAAMVVCPNEAATEHLAVALAETLPTQLVVGLLGTLGVGKTHLVRAFVAALGGRREDVVSPTFVLCQHYACGQRTVNHLDAYRIQDDDEFLELGVDELFDGDETTFVEWSDRVPRCLPDERLDIEISVTGPESRRVVLTARGMRLAPVVLDAVDRFHARLEGK